jgi:hypothetical protein
MRSRHSTRSKSRVPAVYLTSAFLAFSAFVAICRINNLQPVNVACGFESHPLRQTFSSFLLAIACQLGQPLGVCRIGGVDTKHIPVRPSP